MICVDGEFMKLFFCDVLVLLNLMRFDPLRPCDFGVIPIDLEDLKLFFLAKNYCEC